MSIDGALFPPPAAGFLTPPEIAEIAGLSVRTISRCLARAGVSPVGRAQRVAHYRRSDVVDLLTPARSKQPYRIAIAHRKGGQGKTTTTFYLARELVAKGQKVVLRDTDSQQSLTDILDGLGARRDEFNPPTFPQTAGARPRGRSAAIPAGLRTHRHATSVGRLPARHTARWTPTCGLMRCRSWSTKWP
jgi:hypothetical protein